MARSVARLPRPKKLAFNRPCWLSAIRLSFAASDMGGQITVVLRRESQTAVLTIQDTGAGMEPLVADKVFDAYFSTKTAKGHGLGLHAVRQIMTSCGGQISLQSAVGRGSMFKLAFPLKTPLLDELSAASDV